MMVESTGDYPSEPVLRALAGFVPDFATSPVQLCEVAIVNVCGRVVAVDAAEHTETCASFAEWNAAAIERAAKKAGRKG